MTLGPMMVDLQQLPFLVAPAWVPPPHILLPPKYWALANPGYDVPKLLREPVTFMPNYTLVLDVSRHVLLKLTGTEVPFAPPRQTQWFFVLATKWVIQSRAEGTNYELLQGIPSTIEGALRASLVIPPPKVPHSIGTVVKVPLFPLCPFAILESIITYLVPLRGDLLRQLLIHTNGTLSLLSPSLTVSVLPILQSRMRLGLSESSNLQPTPFLQLILLTSLWWVRTLGPETQLTFEMLATYWILLTVLSTVTRAEDTVMTCPVLFPSIRFVNFLGILLLPWMTNSYAAISLVFR